MTRSENATPTMPRRGRLAVKRALDLLGAAFGLVVLAPVLALIAAMIWRKMGRPILFRQVRPGRDGRPFQMVKFRTMLPECDRNGRRLSEVERTTALGHWLRHTSLDELPELANVLRGEMSLVGPRPLLVKYLNRYSPRQARRHEMRPGITGWAQINGRNVISWDEKLEFDVWYVEHWSLALDLRILWATVWKVVRRDDINAAPDLTSPEFLGSAGLPESGVPPRGGESLGNRPHDAACGRLG